MHLLRLLHLRISVNMAVLEIINSITLVSDGDIGK